MHFNLTRKQCDFIGSCEQFPAYVAAVGTGKSTALIIKALFHSQESPNNLGIIVRKNFTDLRDSTIKDFEMYTGFKVSENKKECVLPNGSVILFRHGDELPVLKNINAGFFGIEQAEEFGDNTTWEFLKMRLRRQCKFRTGFIVANTNGHNWIYETWKLKQKVNHRLVEATTYDHSDLLPPDYIQNLETLPKKLYNRYVMNSWEEAEGLVYDEYLEARDTIDPFAIPDGWEKGFVLDHGFRNPTAVLWYAIDFDGNVFIYNEHYEREKPVSYHAQVIKDNGIVSGIADPSIFNRTMSRAEKLYSIADEYTDFGVTLSPAVKSKEDASIARVNEFFKTSRIKIFKSCVETIREIGNWKWKSVRPGYSGNAPEEPEDKDNHACDALKYLISSRFSSPDKPQDKPVIYSLEHFTKQEEYVRQLRIKEEGIKKRW